MEKIQDLISKAAKDMQAKKDELLFKRICERVITDEPINLNEEAQRMFPRIKRVFNSVDQEESWYWNDGSKDGLHLVTFWFEEAKSLYDYDKNSLSVGYKYR